AFEVVALRLDEEVQAHALDQLHDEERLAVGGRAELVSLHDVLVAEAHAPGAFAGPLEPLEPPLELGGLLLVQHLQADDAPEVAVAGAPDLRHAPLAGAADQLEALGDVDPLLLGAAEETGKEAHGTILFFPPPEAGARAKLSARKSRSPAPPPCEGRGGGRRGR